MKIDKLISIMYLRMREDYFRTCYGNKSSSFPKLE